MKYTIYLFTEPTFTRNIVVNKQTYFGERADFFGEKLHLATQPKSHCQREIFVNSLSFSEKEFDFTVTSKDQECYC